MCYSVIFTNISCFFFKLKSVIYGYENKCVCKYNKLNIV